MKKTVNMSRKVWLSPSPMLATRLLAKAITEPGSTTSRMAEWVISIPRLESQASAPSAMRLMCSWYSGSFTVKAWKLPPSSAAISSSMKTIPRKTVLTAAVGPKPRFFSHPMGAAAITVMKRASRKGTTRSWA